jgi:hypothetical protein
VVVSHRWIALLLAGCVHAPPVSPREDCATDAMYLSENERPRRANGEPDAFCRAPATPVEVCEVKASIASLQVKSEFSTGWRNAMIGVGYVLWILPGVGLYFLFDHQSTSAGEDANAEFEAVDNRCLATAPAVRPPPPLAPGHAKMTGKLPVFCTLLTTNPEIGACAFDQATCTKTHDAYVAQGGSYAECRSFPSTACFLVDSDAGQRPYCSPTLVDCERQLAAAKRNPALRVRSAACDEYHVTP